MIKTKQIKLPGYLWVESHIVFAHFDICQWNADLQVQLTLPFEGDFLILRIVESKVV